MGKLQTVVELPEFIRRAKAIMSDEDRDAIVNLVAANPEAGVTAFAKNEKDNLSRTEQAELVRLGKALIAHYGARP